MRNIIAARWAPSMRAFLRDDSGVTAIEYGLIAALIAVVIIGALSLVGKDLSNVFSSVQSGLNSANSANSAG